MPFNPFMPRWHTQGTLYLHAVMIMREVRVRLSGGPVPWPLRQRRRDYALPGEGGGHPGPHEAGDRKAETVFLNVYGAPESIPRYEFRQPM
jgi:hypothetical protein